MKRKKIITLFIILVMAFSLFSQESQAASIRMNRTSVSLYTGSSTTLKVYGASQRPHWSSSKSSVVIVNSKGKVVAKKTGTAVITARIGRKSYRCKVMVKNPYLSRTSITLYRDQTYILRLSGTTAIRWASSSKAIAAVSPNGKVVAKKDGKATIHCRGKDGKQYRCIVTVKHSHKYVTTVVKPTCTDKGYTLHKCSVCGKNYKDAYTNAAGHKWMQER